MMRLNRVVRPLAGRLRAVPGGIGFNARWMASKSRTKKQFALDFQQIAPDTLDFNDAKSAYKSRSTLNLMRSLVIFYLCGLRPLVKHARKLIDLGYATVGSWITNKVIEHTFFAHFCAGTDANTIKPTLEWLRSQGVGGILDYAAEADVSQPRDLGVSSDKLHARTYHYEGEDECDRNAEITLRAIETASAEQGFAAVKVTALGKPELLQHVSTVIYENKRLFRKYFLDEAGRGEETGVDAEMASALAQSMGGGSGPGQAAAGATADEIEAIRDPVAQAERDGLAAMGLGLGPATLADGKSVLAEDPYLSTVVTKEQFHAAMKNSGIHMQTEAIDDLFSAIDKDGSGGFDILEWTDFLSLQTLGRMPVPESVVALRDSKAAGGDQYDARVHSSHQVVMPGAPQRLDDEMIDRLSNMLERARMLAQAAKDANVTIMFDAEQTYLQPAIDHVVHQMQQEFNTNGPPVVFNTYQAYLRDCPRRVEMAMLKARRGGFSFGAKLVRGAYMIQERERARSHGYADPIYPDKESTHRCYDTIASRVLDEIASGRNAQLMIASHNEDSIRRITHRMSELGIDRGSGDVTFGQLLGMCDHLSLTLGQAGYSTFKYLPYGPVDEVVPYLIRRAEENSDVLGATAKESSLILGEVRRRMIGL